MPRGDYYQPVPLDFAILEKLPDEGVIAGIRYAGRLAKHVRQELNDDLRAAGAEEHALSTSEVQSRLRAMHVAGHVKPFPGAAGGLHIWARTPQGSQHLSTKADVLTLGALDIEEVSGDDA